MALDVTSLEKMWKLPCLIAEPSSKQLPTMGHWAELGLLLGCESRPWVKIRKGEKLNTVPFSEKRTLKTMQFRKI
jgi:hypothetical protein